MILEKNVTGRSNSRGQYYEQCLGPNDFLQKKSGYLVQKTTYRAGA